MMASSSSPDLDLANEVSKYYDDPLGFVIFAFPWGEPGPLKNFSGPDKWQVDFLRDLGAEVRKRRFDGEHAVAPIRMTASSGHGIGKSVMAAMLVCWVMSTRPMCQITVSANTFPQLSTRTWMQIQKWFGMCITNHWFKVTSERVFHKTRQAAWQCSAQTCKEENSESFAGQHAAESSSVYIFDESSAIPDKIFEVSEGGLTDGEPMIFMFGNCTRLSGKFHRINFGSERTLWNRRCIDSRASRFTNKEQIVKWIEEHGEDSDFVRVRVRGLPPRASDIQFIDSDRVNAAQRREALYLADDPLIAALDVARGGEDNCVIRFRRGSDAKSIKSLEIPGEQVRDSMRLISVAAEVLSNYYQGNVKVAMLFVDETGVGGPIVDRLKQLGHSNVQGVQFGGMSPDPHYENMRTYMWAMMKEWLPHGAIDSDPQLELDLCGPGYGHNKRDQLTLESKEAMKKRGLASPDHGDALAMTFARHVAPTSSGSMRSRSRHSSRRSGSGERNLRSWMG
jgi:hypothetical protein